MQTKKNRKEKKVALICGGSYGLGFIIAKFFLENNCKIIIVARNINRLKKAKNKLKNKNVEIFKCDLSNNHNVFQLIKNLKKRNIKIDFLICNAGSGKVEKVKNRRFLNYKQAFNQNFFTAVNIIENITDQIKNKKIKIIVISSIAGHFRGGAPLPYSLAKNALIKYSSEISKKLAKNNIRINTISPGHILQTNNSWHKKIIKNKTKTYEMIENNVSLKRFCKPSDVINVIKFLISDNSDYITGTDIVVDGKTS